MQIRKPVLASVAAAVLVAAAIATAGVCEAAAAAAPGPSGNGTYVVDHLSSQNISVIKSPFGLVAAWYRDHYGEAYRQGDLTVNSFATMGDKVGLAFRYEKEGKVYKAAQARITRWVWHPHYADVEFSDGATTISGKVTVLDNTVALLLDPTPANVTVYVGIRNRGIDGGGLRVQRQDPTSFRVDVDWNSRYPRVGAFVDVFASDSQYSGYNVSTTDNVGDKVLRYLQYRGRLGGTDSVEEPAALSMGYVALQYEGGWRQPLLVSLSYSAQDYQHARSARRTDFADTLAEARQQWARFFNEAPWVEPWGSYGTEMYWKSWAIVGINGEDHTVLPAGKYDFVDSVQYLTGKSLGRQVVGHHKYLNAGVPGYDRYWALDNFWSPAVLTFSGRTDVLRSMFQAAFDLQQALGDATDTWSEGRDNHWDNYQAYYAPFILRFAQEMTGDKFYANKAFIENIWEQQKAAFRTGRAQLYTFPVASSPKWSDAYPHDPGPLSAVRTAGNASLLRWLSSMDPKYEDEYRRLVRSLAYFWNPDVAEGDQGPDYYNRTDDGQWSNAPTSPVSIEVKLFVPEAETVSAWLRDKHYGYYYAPAVPAFLTLEGALDPASSYRKNILRVSDYFPEGINPEVSAGLDRRTFASIQAIAWEAQSARDFTDGLMPEEEAEAPYMPDSPNAMLHMLYVANSIIMAKIGLIPYAQIGYDGFIVLPNVTDVRSVSGIHFRDAVLTLNYHGSGLYADIYLDGKKVAGTSGYARRNFLPFELFSKGAHTLDVYYRSNP